MPSQKASKRRRQAARTPPPPPVRARGRRRASPRVLIAAGVVALLVVVGIVLGVVLTGGSDSSSSAPASKLPDAADVQQLLAGIPQNGNVLGNPNAPVTVIQYIDLQCPFCRQFETEVMPTIVEKYVRKGKAKVESRVIYIIGPDSQTGREAALAAATAEQDVQLQPTPLRQPGDGEHGLAGRRRHQVGGREHPRPRREPVPERPRLRHRQERARHDRLAGARRQVSVRRRRSTSCTRAASRSSSPCRPATRPRSRRRSTPPVSSVQPRSRPSSS